MRICISQRQSQKATFSVSMAIRCSRGLVDHMRGEQPRCIAAKAHSLLRCSLAVAAGAHEVISVRNRTHNVRIGSGIRGPPLPREVNTKARTPAQSGTRTIPTGEYRNTAGKTLAKDRPENCFLPSQRDQSPMRSALARLKPAVGPFARTNTCGKIRGDESLARGTDGWP